jgi:PAS domain S-box-containing protein
MQPASKANILLVDDRCENLLALEAILAGSDRNLVRANSGEQALRNLLHQDFAVILLDVQMPKMDGFETASLIRQRERSRTTPIIFITAFSTSDSFVFKGYELGAVDYLLKPIDPVILGSKVSVFVDLFHKNAEIKRQAAELAAINIELKQSEERFRSLSNCAPIGIFLIDPNGRCNYTNPSFHSIFGLPIEESLETYWEKYLHPEDKDRVFAKWSRCLQQKKAFTDEFSLFLLNKNICWVIVQTSPLFCDRGEFLGHVGTLEDITERKLTQMLREQTIREQAAREEAEQANRMKDEFLSIVSHELRTPLNAILGWSQMLLDKKLDETTRNRALETILRNANSQRQLIEDILDVSHIIRGKFKLCPQPIDLINLTEAVLETVRLQAEAKSIQLESAFEPAAMRISGDVQRLQQIIGNLLSNAIKFTPEGGKVEVRVSKRMAEDGMAEDGMAEDGMAEDDIKNNAIEAYAWIEVIDTGIGISPDFLPYIFDRFSQADSSTTRRFGGLGLGLTIVRHLVKLHDGEIFVFSEGRGKGATFTVKLPLLKKNEHSHQNVRKEAEDRQKA